MNTSTKKKTSGESERKQPDESHIIRSDNKINMNRELCGESSRNARRAERDDGRSADSAPSSFPGAGKRK